MLKGHKVAYTMSLLFLGGYKRNKMHNIADILLTAFCDGSSFEQNYSDIIFTFVGLN